MPESDAPAGLTILSGSTFGQRREDIFKRLKHSAEQCKLNYVGRRELATENDDNVADLCEALEDTFSYGLQQQHANVIMTAASLFQNMHEIVTGGTTSSSTNNNDKTFWDFCQAHLTPHERERYAKLKNIWTKVGCGRAFIRSTLNENSLHRYVLTWLADVPLLQRHYSPWSLLLNEEAAKALPDIVNGLQNILFALNVDSVELNVAKSTTTVTGSSTKEEPIIFAPNPVPVAVAKQKRKVHPIERPIVNANSTEDLLGAFRPLETLEVQQILSREELIDKEFLLDPTSGNYKSPVDPIEPELEFLKTPLPDTYTSPEKQQANNITTTAQISNTEQELYEDRSDTSSQYSKSSSSANCSTNQAALEKQIQTLTERCSLLETRVADLSLQNRQLVRRLTAQFKESGIDPSSSLCANYLITIPQVQLVKPQRGSPHYTYEVHVTMRQRLEHWALLRRYRDFYKLHKSLLRTHPFISSVDFPPKKHFGNMNLAFVEERRQQLQIYLLNLVEMLPQVEICKSKAELQKVFPFFRER